MGKAQQRSKSKNIPRYNVDSAAITIWHNLHGDFLRTEPRIGLAASDALRKGIKEYREYEYPELGHISPIRFKMWQQLSSLFKKYRFENDVYTADSLHELTLSKFFSEQERISTYSPYGWFDHQIIQRARKHAKRILGEYDPEYTIERSHFGKKSSIGCPLNLAYIDQKLTDVKAFTGSTECSRWFLEDCLPGDPILKELVTNLTFIKDSDNLRHDTLNLVLVPKTWKIHRPITPLTLLSLFYSYGVGEQITNHLRNVKLDIRKLQAKHANLVEFVSKTKHLATADLSAASDSITSPLLNRILPRKWFNAIRKTFSHQLFVDGKPYYTESVLPMGNGLTFPVETLIFYVLLKSMSELMGKKGRISVYGDDLIYPSKLHQTVAYFFPRFGFKLNLEKTFVSSSFRESCGADYYAGFDVRPTILPDEETSTLTRSRYVVWLYKVINGLRRRWEDHEITATLSFLFSEVTKVQDAVYRVPPTFPDTAGVKVDDPTVIPLGLWYVHWSPVTVRFYGGSRWFHFHYLTVLPKNRVVKSVLPYYWLALQGRDDELEDVKFWDTDYSYFNEAPRQALNWVTVKRVRFGKKKNGKHQRIVRKVRVPVVASRVITKPVAKETKRGSISDWDLRRKDNTSCENRLLVCIEKKLRKAFLDAGRSLQG